MSPTAGNIVETKTGLRGRTYHLKPRINGKIQVFLKSGVNLLCNPATLKIIKNID